MKTFAVELAARAREARVVLIDGHSGSGKTSLAEELAPLLGASILQVEDLYPGWDGLADGSLAVAEALRKGQYRRYDWNQGRFGRTSQIDPLRPLVIEGCGAIRAETLEAARQWSDGSPVYSVWVQCPPPVRRERALARDGETFRPYWERWAAQEDALFAQTHPVELSDKVLSTS